MSFGNLTVDKLLIDGKLVDAEGGAVYENINPATETSLGHAADASAGDIDAAIAAARRAFDQTRRSTDVPFRVRCLRQFADALESHAEEFKALSTAGLRHRRDPGLPLPPLG